MDDSLLQIDINDFKEEMSIVHQYILLSDGM
jgi:hypothetical protein